MNKICTSIEQSKKLIELGIDVNTADMFYADLLVDGNHKYNLHLLESYGFKTFGETKLKTSNHLGFIPVWSLNALMELMNRNCYNVSLNCHGAEWNIKFDDSEQYKAFTKDYAIDAAFEMVVWLKENRKI